MYSLVLVSGLLLTANVFAKTENFNKALDECGKEFKVDAEMLKNDKVANDCFYKCLKVKVGLMNEATGKLLTGAEFRTNKPGKEEDMYKLYEECYAAVKPTNPCADAKALTVCMAKKYLV